MPGRTETALLALLALATFVVHDVGYVLRHRFWVDEDWVAVSTRFPLTQLHAVTSSSPIGWTFVLRLVPFGGPQRFRLVPLVFAALAVVAAYVLARRLSWPNSRFAVGAGVLAGVAVLLSPAMLVRNDLKQYTADAFVTLTILTVLSGVERSWSRRRLGALCATIVVGMLFSHPAAIVGGVALIALVLVQLGRRSWRRLAESAVAAAVAGLGMGLVYLLLDRVTQTPALRSYWANYYVPTDQGIGDGWHFVYLHLHAVRREFGLGPAWLAIPLVIAGLVTLARLGRPAVATAVGLLVPVLVGASAAKQYPLLDLRTSTFAIAIIDVVAAVGAAGICALIARRGRQWMAGVAAAAVLGIYVAGTSSYLRGHTLPNEANVQAQAAYIAQYRAPEDVVLVPIGASWGFAYYCKCGRIVRRADDLVATGFTVHVANRPDIVVAPGNDAPTIQQAVAEAIAQLEARGGSHIWFVHKHVNADEARRWRQAFAAAGVRFISTLVDGLSEYAVPRDGLPSR